MQIFDTPSCSGFSSTYRPLRASCRLAVAVVFAALLGVLVLAPAPVLAQQTFQVDSRSGGLGDTNPGDGVCETSSGTCTLPAAIEEANADPARDVIEFANIDVNSSTGIAQVPLTGELAITEEVFIDGTTAPGYAGTPVVVVDGINLSGASDDGLDIQGTAGTRVDALAIVNFPDDGIEIRGSASGVDVFNCYVGVSPDGAAAGNGDSGIVISTSDNNIGRRSLTQGRNIISDNGNTGILIRAGDDNEIGNNYIGLTADGTAALGNGSDGIRIAGGTGHIIGRESSGFTAGNVVSGNGGNGISLFGTSTSTLIANHVGTSADGQSAVPNGTGIAIESNDNVIGPQNSGAGLNVISGNQFNGIRLGNGGTSESANNNTIQFNYIGVNSSADAPLGNGQGSIEAGVRIDLGSDNLIVENVISGNTRGVFIRGDDSFRNFIRSNFIGTNRNFEDLGNSSDGVRVDVAPPLPVDENEVGGRSDGDGNVIGFNGGDGVEIEGRFNDVYRNFIGTNANGDDLGNDGDGIQLTASDVNVGLSADDGNTIGFNGGNGIRIDASSSIILGNYVGTDAAGADLGNGGAGIEILTSTQANDTRIGYRYTDTVPSDPLPPNGRGNTIAYNGLEGIAVSGSGTLLRNVARGNSIYANTGIGIDLGADGRTDNDFGDGDSGPNNLQNAPEFESSQTQYNTSTGQVEARYQVNCNTTDCNYGTDGLKIDFYLADSGASGEGRTYLFTDAYPESAATSFRNVSFAPPSGVTVTRDDFIVATATDTDGNTSEFTILSQQLPVELADFQAQSSQKAVVLTWRTLSETNNDRFEIEHQRPASGAFARLGTVDGAGTTTEATDYQFLTEDLPAGTHTFRLRQVDVDGTDKLSRTVTAQVMLSEPLVMSGPSPNPVRNQMTYRVGVQKSQTVRVVLYDLLGRAVATLHEGMLPGGEERVLRATLPTLPSGKYFLRLEGETGQAVQPVTVVR